MAVAAPASAAPAPAQPEISIDFRLPANNGLHAHLTNPKKLQLEIRRKGRLVVYEAPGEVTETGVKARFGTLGSIDVSFEPTKVVKENPPKGCSGEPSTLSDGFFVGRIEFTGERKYVRIDASRAKGTMDVMRQWGWHCRRQPATQIGQRGADGLASRPLLRGRGTEGTAALTLFDRRHKRFFAAYGFHGPRGRGGSVFVGAALERRERMRITRATVAQAGSGAFSFDLAAGTATVRPPLPFTGHGTFKRRAHGPGLWQSTIRVPLLGAGPLSVRGGDYRASLKKSLPGD